MISQWKDLIITETNKCTSYKKLKIISPVLMSKAIIDDKAKLLLDI
jgi:hypothetical protein